MPGGTGARAGSGRMGRGDGGQGGGCTRRSQKGGGARRAHARVLAAGRAMATRVSCAVRTRLAGSSSSSSRPSHAGAPYPHLCHRLLRRLVQRSSGLRLPLGLRMQNGRVCMSSVMMMHGRSGGGVGGWVDVVGAPYAAGPPWTSTHRQMCIHAPHPCPHKQEQLSRASSQHVVQAGCLPWPAALRGFPGGPPAKVPSPLPSTGKHTHAHAHMQLPPSAWPAPTCAASTAAICCWPASSRCR